MAIFSAAGTTITWDGIPVGGITGYNGFDGEAPDLDVTTFADTEWKQFVPGLMDNGAFSLDVFRDPDDLGQAAMDTAANTQTMGEVVMTFLDWGTVTFDAYVQSMPIAGGVDAHLTGTIPLRISGEPVWAETP